VTQGIPDAALLEAFEATWPPAEVARHGGLETGRGLGAGGRVSSTRAAGDWDPGDLDAAEAQHRAWGQPPLARAWEGEAFAAHLEARPGWRRVNPTALLAIDVAGLSDRPPRPMTAITVAWPPLAVQRALWAAGRIDAARQAVMARVAEPKACLLGRVKDHAGATGFVALHGSVAFLHALHVAPELRRHGLGAALMRKAAVWAQAQGAGRLALAVSLGNTAALALYDSLGFGEAGRYAYWERD
jgi:ribosomal protein S18 acetylase RimI-like enzyme